MTQANVLVVCLLTTALVGCAAGSAVSAGGPLASSHGDVVSEAVGTWYAADGSKATRSNKSFEVHGLRGAAHCDWQTVTFLSLLWPVGRRLTSGEDFTASDTRQFVRDPDGKLDAARLLGTLDLDATLPADAVNTGYHTESLELWLGPDGGDRYVYIVSASHTERWPRAREVVACM